VQWFHNFLSKVKMLPPWLNITLQIVAALVVVVLLYILTLVILNIDALVIKSTLDINQKEKTMIVNGYAGPGYLKESNFNTINPMIENFRKIAKSVNMKGGAEFTYQFWVKIEDTNEENFKNLILILKGDKKKYKIGLYNKNSTNMMNQYLLTKTEPEDNWIACPMIKFGSSYKDIEVRFNTTKNYASKINITMNPEGDPSSRKNLLSMLPVNWTLLTFVFRDNFSSIENAENGIIFTMYVNDIAYWQTSPAINADLQNNFLKQNDGNLFIMPNATNSSEFMKMGNIMYHNYAVTQDEVRSTYLSGPPKFSAKESEAGRSIEPSYISALNKIDIYNY
jgi:hypothetical protein